MESINMGVKFDESNKNDYKRIAEFAEKKLLEQANDQDSLLLLLRKSASEGIEKFKEEFQNMEKQENENG
jgi:hypothetical protein